MNMPRKYSTAGTMARHVVPADGGRPVTAVMLRPRVDLMCAGAGLRVELSCWCPPDGSGAERRVADFGHESRVGVLAYHVVWAWEVLPASEVDRVVALDIDGRVRVRRVDGELMDLTAYRLLEERILSEAEVRSRPLHTRVALVHEAVRRSHADMDDAAIGDLYGLGTRLIDYAQRMVAPTGEAGGREGSGAGGALAGLVSRVGAAATHDDLVACCEEAMLDYGCDLGMLTRACSRAGVPAKGLARAWEDAREGLEGM